MRRTSLILLAASICLPLCHAKDSAAPDAETSPSPTAQDVAACERNAKNFLAADYVGDNSVAVRHFTKEFARLWLWACNPPEGETIYWGADPILETQDDEPELVRFGPGIDKAGKIEVPVVYRHRGKKPFTKKFVFIHRDDTWRISDIVSSGDLYATVSEFAALSKAMKASP